MRKIGENRLPILSPEEAAIYAVASAKRIQALGLPEYFTGEEIMGSVRQAVLVRESKGFKADPTCREEIDGLVNSAMGGFGHLRPVRKELWHFTAGLLQTNESLMAMAGGTMFDELQEVVK